MTFISVHTRINSPRWIKMFDFNIQQCLLICLQCGMCVQTVSRKFILVLPLDFNKIQFRNMKILYVFLSYSINEDHDIFSGNSYGNSTNSRNFNSTLLPLGAHACNFIGFHQKYFWYFITPWFQELKRKHTGKSNQKMRISFWIITDRIYLQLF